MTMFVVFVHVSCFNSVPNCLTLIFILTNKNLVICILSHIRSFDFDSCSTDTWCSWYRNVCDIKRKFLLQSWVSIQQLVVWHSGPWIWTECFYRNISIIMLVCNVTIYFNGIPFGIILFAFDFEFLYYPLHGSLCILLSNCVMATSVIMPGTKY